MGVDTESYLDWKKAEFNGLCWIGWGLNWTGLVALDCHIVEQSGSQQHTTTTNAGNGNRRMGRNGGPMDIVRVS
jgi:hypothetical protein